VQQKKRFEGVDIMPMQYGLIQQELDDFKDVQTFEFFDQIDNEFEIISTAKVPELPFFIVIENEADELSQQAFLIARALSFFVLLAALLAALMIYLLIVRFLKPLINLRDVVRKMVKGDLKQRAQISSRDEVGELAGEFNNLAERLDKTIDNIEGEVEERTSELKKLNKYMTGRELKMIELKKQIQKLENELEK